MQLTVTAIACAADTHSVKSCSIDVLVIPFAFWIIQPSTMDWGVLYIYPYARGSRGKKKETMGFLSGFSRSWETLYSHIPEQISDPLHFQSFLQTSSVGGFECKVRGVKWGCPVWLVKLFEHSLTWRSHLFFYALLSVSREIVCVNREDSQVPYFNVCLLKNLP